MRRLFLVLALLFSVSLAVWAAKSDIGVLVMAHGGTETWNKIVKTAVKQANIPYPTRVYFGMGHSKEEVDELQEDVQYLEGKGVRQIIVIPLLVSSYSE